MELSADALRGYLDYLRDLGIYDLYRGGSDPQMQPQVEAFLKTLPTVTQARTPVSPARLTIAPSVRPTPAQPFASPLSLEPIRARFGPEIVITRPAAAAPAPPSFEEDVPYPETGPFAPPSMPLVSLNNLAPMPSARLSPGQKPAALDALRQHIGDCTREEVYIANVVKCRPPKNRVPEPVEANTCSQFLLQQIDIVEPKVIVALGATAALYLLGVKQSLAALRGQWHDVRGAKCAVTYHPAFLLRDPRQKGEAWKDLQRVMTELQLKPPARA